MMKALRRPFVLIVSSVLLGALWLPGIGSAQAPSVRATTSPGEAGTDQLVSDDGRLTLTMPLGVDVAGLSVVPVLVSAPVMAAYELRPLDTTFPEPVYASWQLDPAGVPPATNGDLVWLALARADDAAAGPWSWLDDAHVSITDGDYLLTGGLSRFGTLVVTMLPTLVHGPEAIWGPGYSPGRGVDVPLDLTLSERVRQYWDGCLQWRLAVRGWLSGLHRSHHRGRRDGPPGGRLAVPADRRDVPQDHIRYPAGHA